MIRKIRIRRMISCFLVVCMLSMMLPGRENIVYAANEINTFEVINFEKPVVGNSMNFSVSLRSENEGYHLATKSEMEKYINSSLIKNLDTTDCVAWYDVTEKKYITAAEQNSAKFEADKKYRAEIFLFPDEGYKVSTSSAREGLINYHSSDVEFSFYFADYGNCVVLQTKDYDTTSNITKIELDGYQAPVVGEYPNYDVSVVDDEMYRIATQEEATAAGKDAPIAWYQKSSSTSTYHLMNSTDQFNEFYAYATILIVAKDGRTIDQNVDIKMNGGKKYPNITLTQSYKKDKGNVNIHTNAYLPFTGNTIEVIDGTVNAKKYAPDSTVTIKANTPPAGKIFDKWEIVEGTNSLTIKELNNPKSNVILYDNVPVKIKACYKDATGVIDTINVTGFVPPVEDEPLNVYIDHPLDCHFHLAKEVERDELGIDEGRSFQWLSHGKLSSEKYASMYLVPDKGYVFSENPTIKINGLETNVNLSKCEINPKGYVRVISIDYEPQSATTAYNISVENGKAMNSEGVEIENATLHSAVNLIPDEAPAGKSFLKWEVVEGSAKVKDNSFEMPSEDIKIKAVYGTTISSVDLSSVKIPYIGNKISQKVSIPSDCHYHIATSEELFAMDLKTLHSGFLWFTSLSTMIGEGYSYQADELVYANAYLVPDDGYAFSKNLIASINGSSLFVKSDTTMISPQGYASIRSIDLTPKKAEVISLIDINDLSYPGVNMHPGFSASVKSDCHYHIMTEEEKKETYETGYGMYWESKADGTISPAQTDYVFKSDDEVKAHLILVPEEGYKFDESLSATINENVATVDENDPFEKVYISTDFMKTRASYQISVLGGKASTDWAMPKDVVKLSADVPSGKAFDRWEITNDSASVEFSNVNDPNATFVMTNSNLEIKAVYKDATIQGSISDVTVDGVVGTALSDTKLTFTLSNAMFITDALKVAEILSGISDWSQYLNLPDGVSIKLKDLSDYMISPDRKSLSIIVSGIPASNKMDTINAKIPKGLVEGAITDVLITANPNAKWNITSGASMSSNDVSGSVVVGQLFTSGKMKYKVMTVNSDGTGTVSLTGTTKSKKTTSLTIGNTVKIKGKTFKITAISNKALKGFSKLKKVTVGTSVTSIGKEAFAGCKVLKSITIKSKKLKKIGKNAIKGIHKKAVLKVPSSKLKAYKKLFKSSTGYKKSMKLKK